MNSTAHRSQDWNPTSTITGANAMTRASERRLPLSEETTPTMANHTRARRIRERSR